MSSVSNKGGMQAVQNAPTIRYIHPVLFSWYEWYRRTWYFHRGLAPLQGIIPAVTGSIVLIASVLPWLLNPLGGTVSAWGVPFNIGWPLPLPQVFSYGLLCLCWGIYAWVIGVKNWRAVKRQELAVSVRPTLAGVLGVALFVSILWQYLVVDMGGINQLAQEQIQTLFTQNNFGYNVPAALFPLDLSSWDISTPFGRFELLADNAGLGMFLPFICGFILLASRGLFGPSLVKTIRPADRRRRFISNMLAPTLILVLVVLFGRGLAAIGCEYVAKGFLATGDYTSALGWLDTAVLFNPTFDQVSYYHMERGQAMYFLHGRQLNAESSVYLAHNYRLQRYYSDAYQQLIDIWNQGQRQSWLKDELTITLEQYSQSFRPLTTIASAAATTYTPTNTSNMPATTGVTGSVNNASPGLGNSMNQATQAANTDPNSSSSAVMPNQSVTTDPTGASATAQATGQTTQGNQNMQTPITDPNNIILPIQRMANDTLALPWLQRLQQVDPSNIYAQYLSARIQFDLHNYELCKEEMYSAIQISKNPTVLSSAYTYIALSDAQEGNYADSRLMLLKAATLDPAYYNNTAREQLSGLH